VSVKFFQIISELSKAQHFGNQISNPHTWANNASLAAAFAGIINIVISILTIIGIELPTNISQNEITSIATFVAAIFIFASNYIHKACNKEAGN